MTVLPLSPFIAAAFVCVAAAMPPAGGAAPETATATERPVVRHVSAESGWQQYLLVGPGPVFRHRSGPLRG